MRIYRIRSFEEYRQHAHLMQAEYLERCDYEKRLLPKYRKNFKVKGFSYPIGRTVQFLVDYNYQTDAGVPNWRERLVCPVSHLNNRMRASVQIFETECSPYQDHRIYITEQTTPLYSFCAERYPNVTGSEFLGTGISSGACNASGIRHEDLTHLSFEDRSFDHVVSFDCFEHIPCYTEAFSESFRVLANGGKMLFSVPFALRSQMNITRARETFEGNIEHIMEPEYHGDPMNSEGCLCFRYFGWEMLEELLNVGFNDVYAVFYWSKTYGYLGQEQVLFIAKK